MHRTQIYIEDDIFSKIKAISNTLNISVSQFIRNAVNNELEKDSKNDMEDFFNSFDSLKSFEDIDSKEYVQTLRSKSRIIDE
jgi:hypothetical protein